MSAGFTIPSPVTPPHPKVLSAFELLLLRFREYTQEIERSNEWYKEFTHRYRDHFRTPPSESDPYHTAEVSGDLERRQGIITRLRDSYLENCYDSELLLQISKIFADLSLASMHKRIVESGSCDQETSIRITNDAIIYGEAAWITGYWSGLFPFPAFHNIFPFET